MKTNDRFRKYVDEGTALYREFEITAEQVRADEGDDAEESRLYELAFSSETGVVRWGMEEVLSHDADSVRLDRLNGGAPLLLQHDHDVQIGVVESARVDGDKMGRAQVRFSRSALGEEIRQDVEDKIRRLVSVGYRIHKYEVSEREGSPDLVRVTDWEPFEVSVVSVPADMAVGFGRSDSAAAESKLTPEGETMNDKVKEQDRAEETRAEETSATVDPEVASQRAVTEERRRSRAIREIADVHRCDELAREAIEDGWTVERFNTEVLKVIGERNARARAEHPEADGEVDLPKSDGKRYSLLRLMEALANPNDHAAQQRAGLELEVSAEAVRGFGGDFKARGAFVPTSLLEGESYRRQMIDMGMAREIGHGKTMTRTLSAGTATDGAELVATNLLAADYIEVLRNVSATTRMGLMILSGLVGDVAIPRQTAGAASTWISAEDGDAGNSEAQFDQVSLTPKDLACYTEVTRRLLMQSTPAIEGIVRMDLAIAQALGIDLAVLYGSGASGQPTGVANQSGINTFNLAAADPTYAEIVRMIKEVMVDNALPMSAGSTGFIIEANGWEALSTTPKQGSGVEGNFILGDNDRIKGYPYVNSNQVTAEDYFFGDWSQAILGEWGGLEINVDPYTHSLKGRIRFVTFKTADVAVRHPVAFCFVNDGV